jgi:hypothetical protein
MKLLFSSTLPALLMLTTNVAFGSHPDVIKASRHDTSPPFSQIASQSPATSNGELSCPEGYGVITAKFLVASIMQQETHGTLAADNLRSTG